MAKPKDYPKDPKGPKGPKDRGEGPRRRGRERQVHEDLANERLGGGAPATSDAYQRAIEQWQQLPGSVVRPASDIKAPDNKRPEPDADGTPPRSGGES